MRAELAATILAAAAWAAACSDDGGGVPWDGGDVADLDAPVEGPDAPLDSPGDVGDAVDHVDDVDCFQDIDIVFVIDVSTSMTWVLDELHDEIGAVWAFAEAISSHPDYDPAFGLVVFVDDVLVTNDGNPYASSADLQTEFNDWRTFCSSNSQPAGSSCMNGDCQENSLDALAAAAEHYAWRPGALHVIIHATDDTFKESPQMLCSEMSPTIPVEHTYSQTIDLLVAGEVRVGVFAMHVSPCWTSADTEPGFFSSWGGQPSIPEATGSRVWDLTQVQSGAISLTEAIQGFVLEEWCTEFI